MLKRRHLQLLAFPRRSCKNQWSNWRPAYTEQVFLWYLQSKEGLCLQHRVEVNLSVGPTAQEEVPGGGRKQETTLRVLSLMITKISQGAWPWTIFLLCKGLCFLKQQLPGCAMCCRDAALLLPSIKLNEGLYWPLMGCGPGLPENCWSRAEHCSSWACLMQIKCKPGLSACFTETALGAFHGWWGELLAEMGASHLNSGSYWWVFWCQKNL